MNNKEVLQKRIFGFKQAISDIDNQIIQLTANRHATQGAIQEAEYWISQIPAEEVKTEEKEAKA